MRAALELLARGLGDEHLTALGGVGHPRGDVDVDAEVVAAELARPAVVHPGAHGGAVAIDFHLPQA